MLKKLLKIVGKPTREQKERLSKITNPQQRAALLDAIKKDEPIPEYAWCPVPADVDCAQMYLHYARREAGVRLRALEAGTTLEEMIKTDPQAAADALFDAAIFEEILGRTKGV